MYENEKQILTQFEEKLHELIAKYNKQKELNLQLTQQISEKEELYFPLVLSLYVGKQ